MTNEEIQTRLKHIQNVRHFDTEAGFAHEAILYRDVLRAISHLNGITGYELIEAVLADRGGIEL